MRAHAYHWVLAIALFTFFLAFAENSAARSNNFHLIQEDTTTGFAIYRTSRPSREDMATFCELGIAEMMVLSGNAEDWEYKHQAACPGLKVVYNQAQKAKIPLTKSFLDFFDEWIAEAKRTGKKIAFRCNCGCHRTGRLAAYFQLKYQKLTVRDAQVIMKRYGKGMMFYRFLWPQVVAIDAYIKGKECPVAKEYCVQLDK